jgi:hypothetical protein
MPTGAGTNGPTTGQIIRPRFDFETCSFGQGSCSDALLGCMRKVFGL